jgi:hypothetical protein
MYRYVLLIVLLLSVNAAWSQHVSLHWYNLKSVAPLGIEEGKMALTRMKQMTTDSLASFTDRGDYFQIATKTPIDWPSFSAAMESSGYYIADVSRPSEHHDEYVKMGLAYQQASYLLSEQELPQLTIISEVVLTHVEFEALSSEKQERWQSNPINIQVKE